MTKREFLEQIPDMIEHRAHGYGELEIINDTSHEKEFVIGIKINLQVGAPMETHGLKFSKN